MDSIRSKLHLKYGNEAISKEAINYCVDKLKSHSK